MRVARYTLLFVVASCLLFIPQARAIEAFGNAMKINSFVADYYLNKDSDGVSTLRIVEKIDVSFIDNSLHGLRRAIPNVYDGHSTKLNIARVSDNGNSSVKYSTENSNGNTILKIGDPSTTVTGNRLYEIEYTQRYVTKSFANHDELYWDTNGTEWGQMISKLKATVHLQGEAAKAYNGQYRCFQGAVNASSPCKTTDPTKSDGEVTLAFESAHLLFTGENVTFVIGFKPNTFAQYKKSFAENYLSTALDKMLQIGGAVVALAITSAIWLWRRFGRSPKGRGTIVPEYLPPDGDSVLASSMILKRKGSDMAAQIIDFAVRGYIRIYETEQKALLGKKKSYELEFVKPLVNASAEEKKLFSTIFGDSPKTGTKVSFDSVKPSLTGAGLAINKIVKDGIQSAGYLGDSKVGRKYTLWLAGFFGLLSALALNPIAAAGATILLILALSFSPLSELGVAKRDYLLGLKDYMQLAEADRIQTLQSPKGAQRIPTAVKAAASGDNSQLVKLYERLLPYAMVFGIEKDWIKTFATLYNDDQAPDWYSGNWAAFNAASFASSLNSFATVSNATYAAPTNSSSSGFSSGGGFSGGGGGGGGGGAW